MSQEIIFDNMSEFHRIILTDGHCNIAPCRHTNHLVLHYTEDSKNP